MHISVLRYFLEVVEKGSVRRAAETMNITPSAISRHIGILEGRVGAPLFERRARGMALTAEGQIFTKYARRMVSNLDLVRDAVEEIKGLRSGTVRIHAIEAVASTLLCPAIREFLKQHSGISIEVDIAGRDNNAVLHSLLTDKADIGIMYRLSLNTELQYEADFETPFVVVASPEHPFAQMKDISALELNDTPIAGLGPSSATRRLTEEALRSVDARPNYTLTVDSFEMAKQFARTGVGITVLPEIAIRDDCESGTLVAIPFRECALRHVRSAVCTHRGRTLPKAAQAFVQSLKLFAANANSRGI